MTTRILSKRGKKAEKPAKPRADFPLFPHNCGQWAKKVRGKLHYFGVWSDPVKAEAQWERDKIAILEGRDPERASQGDSVGWLCDIFMDSKDLQRERGDLSKRALDDYHKACKNIAAYFGKGRRLDSLQSDDFERYRNSLPGSWSPTTINNHLRLVRVVFKYCNDIGATERTIRYHIGLKAVSRARIRKHAATLHAKEFTMEEIHKLLSHSDVMMKAFVLLGINCGYGTMDIGRLKRADIDFEKSWLGAPRGKTGTCRGAWLWPETVKALRAAVDASPEATLEKWSELAFLTRNRQPWADDGVKNNPLTQAFRKLKIAAGLHRLGVGHYSLRHTFETIAGDAKDQPAVDYVMGHTDQSMAGTYREGIDPKRIIAVCQHVRKEFLKAKPKKKRGENPSSPAAKGDA